MAWFEVRGIEKKFGKTRVLKGIDFSLEKGDVLAIIGSSGSGKTTLLRCINFLEQPDAGEIIFRDEKLFRAGEKYSEAEIRGKRLHFGLVFQQFNLFPQYSVMGNLCLAPRLLKLGTEAEILSNANDILSKMGLADRAASYPCELSGGQQQRVAIARALMLRPEVLCFDEPTSALDPELTGEVLRAIRELKSADRSMIIVTHEMEFARNIADRVIYMADGVIEEQGTPRQIFENPVSEKLKSFLAKSPRI